MTIEEVRKLKAGHVVRDERGYHLVIAKGKRRIMTLMDKHPWRRMIRAGRRDPEMICLHQEFRK